MNRPDNGCQDRGLLGGNKGPSPSRNNGRRRDEGPSGVSLLVRNLSLNITTQDLEKAFMRIGNVRDVYIPKDFHSQQPKGFAFVEYATHDQASEAKEEMNKFVMKGRQLEVLFAQEKRKSPFEMRGRVVDADIPKNSRGRLERSSSFERHQRKERNQLDRGGSDGGRGGGRYSF